MKEVDGAGGVGGVGKNLFDKQWRIYGLVWNIETHRKSTIYAAASVPLAERSDQRKYKSFQKSQRS